jgi:hypothetical protein
MPVVALKRRNSETLAHDHKGNAAPLQARQGTVEHSTSLSALRRLHWRAECGVSCERRTRQRSGCLLKASWRGVERGKKDQNFQEQFTPSDEILKIFSHHSRTKFFITSVILIRCAFLPLAFVDVPGAIDDVRRNSRPGDNSVLIHLNA